jgi:hypothetical protein
MISYEGKLGERVFLCYSSARSPNANKVKPDKSSSLPKLAIRLFSRQTDQIRRRQVPYALTTIGADILDVRSQKVESSCSKACSDFVTKKRMPVTRSSSGHNLYQRQSAFGDYLRGSESFLYVNYRSWVLATVTVRSVRGNSGTLVSLSRGTILSEGWIYE